MAHQQLGRENWTCDNAGHAILACRTAFLGQGKGHSRLNGDETTGMGGGKENSLREKSNTPPIETQAKGKLPTSEAARNLDNEIRGKKNTLYWDRELRSKTTRPSGGKDKGY